MVGVSLCLGWLNQHVNTEMRDVTSTTKGHVGYREIKYNFGFWPEKRINSQSACTGPADRKQ